MQNNIHIELCVVNYALTTFSLKGSQRDLRRLVDALNTAMKHNTDHGMEADNVRLGEIYDELHKVMGIIGKLD